jgi:diguanylate cyclase (GGDEF)-like protein/PAS domain S-box-containing protein
MSSSAPVPRTGQDPLPGSGDERFRALFDDASSGVALSELDGTFIDVNPRLRELLAGTGVELLRHGLADLARHLPEGSDDARAWREALADVRAGRRPVARAELAVAPSDAAPRWLQVTAALVVLGERRLLLSHVEDTTERRPAEQGIARLPLRDGLTGLVDRAFLADRLAAVSAASDAVATGLLRLDLQDFAHVNDVLGRDDGDAVLVAVAQRLTGLVRAEDTVARLDGVSFAVLAGDLPDAGALAGLARRLRRELAEPLDVAAARLRIAVAVGGDLLRPGDCLAAALLRAEQAVLADRREHRRTAEVDVREADLRETDQRETGVPDEPEVRGGELRETDQRPA